LNILLEEDSGKKMRKYNRTAGEANVLVSNTTVKERKRLK